MGNCTCFYYIIYDQTMKVSSMHTEYNASDPYLYVIILFAPELAPRKAVIIETVAIIGPIISLG